MSQKKVLLIVPPTGLYIREDRCQTPIEELKTIAIRPPIDLMYAGAGFEQARTLCKIEDYPAEKKSWSDFEKDLKEFQPDILVISITTPSLIDDLKACDIAKKVNPKILTIAKGAHFNIFDKETLKQFPNLDAVLRGEYEITCREIGIQTTFKDIKGITYCQNNEIIRNPDRPFCENLDELPFPARHLIKNQLYIRPDTGEMQTTLVTNRGCPYNCIFCLAQQVAGKKVRMRSPENIVAEIEECINKFGIRNFLFRSDLFTANSDWVKRLCELIIRKNLKIEWACNSRVDTLNQEMLQMMKRAGCWLIAFGVESGNEEMLKKMRKNCSVDKAIKIFPLVRASGIKSSIYFLIGFPWDTPMTMKDNIRLAKRIDPDFIEIFYVYPFPGTELYDFAVQNNLLKKGEIPKAAYSHPAMPGLYMTAQEFNKWRKKILRSFYLRPAYILRTLIRAKSPKIIQNYIKYGLVQLVDLFRR